MSVVLRVVLAGAVRSVRPGVRRLGVSGTAGPAQSSGRRIHRDYRESGTACHPGEPVAELRGRDPGHRAAVQILDHQRRTVMDLSKMDEL
jgi:hypothetical protein